MQTHCAHSKTSTNKQSVIIFSDQSRDDESRRKQKSCTLTLRVLPNLSTALGGNLNTIFVLPSTTRCRVQFIRFTSCKMSHNTYVRYVSVSSHLHYPLKGPVHQVHILQSITQQIRQRCQFSTSHIHYPLQGPVHQVHILQSVTQNIRQRCQFSVSHLHYSSSSLRLKNVTRNIRQRCLSFLSHTSTTVHQVYQVRLKNVTQQVRQRCLSFLE